MIHLLCVLRSHGEMHTLRLPEDMSEGITLNRLPEEIRSRICELGQIIPGMSTIYITQELLNIDPNFNLCLIHELAQVFYDTPSDMARLFTSPELPIHLVILCGMSNVIFSRMGRESTEGDRIHCDRLSNCVHIGRYYVIHPTCTNLPEYNDNESMLRSLLSMHSKLNIGEVFSLARRIMRYRDGLDPDLRILVELAMYSDVVSVVWESYNDRYGYYMDVHCRNRKTANRICGLLGADLGQPKCVSRGVYRIELSALHLNRYNRVEAIIKHIRTEFMRGFREMCLVD